ncbi:sugar ABC transporter permease [Georgenia sp. TF02-10]|uniref:carbohydrate ABC transporter permease n=1 Tax=Georgenia sp. TF02-10 TaxID=2917725 RepID=UPI001FA74D98|nr:sugar ABC transporter permease [Georgenia sp. TF02-10]UNX55184.1 sugar ABC transporter permease [Georgenia sp. TF02-10]
MALPTAPTRPRAGARRRSEARTGWLFLLPFGLLFTLVFLIPIVVSVYNSFFSTRRSSLGLAAPETVFVGLSNYVDVLTSSQLWLGMGRVVGYAAVQIPIMILAALALALLLDSVAARHVTFYRLAYFLPYAIPGVIAAMVWTYLYQPNLSPIVQALHAVGLDVNLLAPGTVLGSMANITTWTFTGYNMLIFLAALQAVPRELYEAARMDGASEWRIVRAIKVPMLRGATMLAVLLSIIGTIQLFNEPTVMRRSAAFIDSQYTPMMMAYDQAFGPAANSGAAATVSIVMAAVAGVLAWAYTVVSRRTS